MKEFKFEDLLTSELSELYDAEKQILRALPKMRGASTSEELAGAFEEHEQQTQEHVKRLERIFAKIGETAGGQPCEGMRGLLREGDKLISEIQKSPGLDTALISAAQKVEHYEIAGYGTACAIATFLGKPDLAELLEETLDEEKETDSTLTEIAEAIMSGDSQIEESEEEEIEVEEGTVR